MQDWLKVQEMKQLCTKPGSPGENGHIESFHAFMTELRDECLNRELFDNPHEARYPGKLARRI